MKVGDLVKKITRIADGDNGLGLVTSRDDKVFEVTWGNGEVFWYLLAHLQLVQEGQGVGPTLT